MSEDQRFELRIGSEMLAALDQARGTTPRAEWVKDAIQRRLLQERIGAPVRSPRPSILRETVVEVSFTVGDGDESWYSVQYELPERPDATQLATFREETLAAWAAVGGDEPSTVNVQVAMVQRPRRLR